LSDGTVEIASDLFLFPIFLSFPSVWDISTSSCPLIVGAAVPRILDEIFPDCMWNSEN
jgi:hypothetical protein